MISFSLYKKSLLVKLFCLVKIVDKLLLDFSVKESGIFTQDLVTHAFLKLTVQNNDLLFEDL